MEELIPLIEAFWGSREHGRRKAARAILDILVHRYDELKWREIEWEPYSHLHEEHAYQARVSDRDYLLIVKCSEGPTDHASGWGFTFRFSILAGEDVVLSVAYDIAERGAVEPHVTEHRSSELWPQEFGHLVMDLYHCVRANVKGGG